MSIIILSHFHSGVSEGWINPAGLWCSAFTCWQVRHLLTKVNTSRFIPGHQYFCLKSWYILVVLGFIEQGAWWASIKSCILSTSWFGTQILHLKSMVPTLKIENSSCFPSWTSCLILVDSSSCNCASRVWSRSIGCVASLLATIWRPKSRISFYNSSGKPWIAIRVPVDFLLRAFATRLAFPRW